jgi:hypothetical protein
VCEYRFIYTNDNETMSLKHYLKKKKISCDTICNENKVIFSGLAISTI